MLKIANKQFGKHAELWLIEDDSDDSSWAFGILPIQLHQDRGLRAGINFQQASDLDLSSLPLYACKIPSVMLFPYVTYFASTWGGNRLPSFMILNTPLNKQDGINWLHLSSLTPFHYMNGGIKNTLVAMGINNNPTDTEVSKFERDMRAASAAKTYLLNEIRYVYNAAASAFDGHHTSRSERHVFTEETIQPNVTKDYLTWYIEKFSSFYNTLLNIGKQEDPESRTLCFITGITVSRLAAEAMTILSTDVPFIRIWQFFDFLDATANLINSLTGDGSGEKQKVLRILSRSFYQDDLLPVLSNIPVAPIREEIINHTGNIYNAIENMAIDKRHKTNSGLSGAKILWAYRNTHHGYALRDDKEALIRHSGKIPDDFPDLVIALWHYILAKFPFKQ